MMRKFIYFTSIVSINAWHTSSEVCSSESECAANWVYNKCCLQPSGISYCESWCTYTDVENKKSMQGVIMGFQQAAGMKVSEELDCMTNHIDQDVIAARLMNSYHYGKNGGYYMPTQQLNTLGYLVSEAAEACPSFWSKLWFDVVEVAEITVDISKLICEYQYPLMIGSAICAPAAAPITASAIKGSCALAGIDGLYECGRDALNII